MEKKKTAEAKASSDSAKKEGGEKSFAGFDFASLEMTMNEMLKAGVHFGHKKSRKHPKMEEYIYGTKKGINIIDLQASVKKMKEAVEFIKKIKKEGKQILFVGTKKQAKELTKAAAMQCDMPFVTERWLGGTFTNFKNIKKRTQYLKESEAMLERGDFKKYTKFEQAKKKEEIEKLEKKMGGIKNMDEIPGAIFVMDAKEDDSSIKEAEKVGVPIVALADSNIDPSRLDYPIPANDDAVSSLKLILAYVCKALSE